MTLNRAVLEANAKKICMLDFRGCCNSTEIVPYIYISIYIYPYIYIYVYPYIYI